MQQKHPSFVHFLLDHLYPNNETAFYYDNLMNIHSCG